MVQCSKVFRQSFFCILQVIIPVTVQCTSHITTKYVIYYAGACKSAYKPYASHYSFSWVTWLLHKNVSGFKTYFSVLLLVLQLLTWTKLNNESLIYWVLQLIVHTSCSLEYNTFLILNI